jgi:hypothetical protein
MSDLPQDTGWGTLPTPIFYIRRNMHISEVTIASDVTGKKPPASADLYGLPHGHGADGSLYEVLFCAAAETEFLHEGASWAKWMKISFENYFLYKMDHGLGNWQ